MPKKIKIPFLARLVIYLLILLSVFVWIFSKTKDNLEINGWWIKNKSDKAIILCHGIGTSKADMLNYIPFLYKEGYNLLVFDFRGHGKNKSKHNSLGFSEINDVFAAVEFIKTKKIDKIGGLGISLGASTLIRAAARTDGFKAIVSDSAFARLDPMIASYAKRLYHLPYWPVVVLVKKVTELRTGFHYDAVNPVDDIKNVHVPVYIIHGLNDSNIPSKNAEEIFAAANEPKKLLMVPNADHVESHSTMQKKYESEVLKFFEKYLK